MIRIALSILFSAASGASAASGEALLRIPVHARSLGLGYGAAAVAHDTEAMTSNPAGLGRLQAKETGLLYAPLLQGMSLGWLAYAQPTAWGVVGVGYLGLRSGAVDGRDDSGNPAGSFSAEDRAVTVSFARGLGGRGLPTPARARLGANLKLVQSRVASFTASTYAADLGAQAPVRALGRTASIGAAIRNLGPGLKHLEERTPLPLDGTVAIATRLSGSLLLGAGVRHLVHDHRTEFNLGTEVSPLGAVALRASYGLWREGGPLPQIGNSLAFGMGLERGSWRLDYAIMPGTELGATQRISVAVRFDRAPERRAWAAKTAWADGDEP